MLQCARQVMSHVKVSSARAVLCYSVLGECCFALLHAWRVLSHVVVCSLKAVLRYGMIGECCLVSKYAQ